MSHHDDRQRETLAPAAAGLTPEQAADLNRLAHDLDALEREGAGDLWAMRREVELLTLAGADDPTARPRRLYSLDRIEGPEDRPRARDLAERLTDAALRLGDPRSPEYRAGCVAHVTARLLRHALGSSHGMEPCPHSLGTAAADAWFSGVERGRVTFADFLAMTEEEREP